MSNLRVDELESLTTGRTILVDDIDTEMRTDLANPATGSSLIGGMEFIPVTKFGVRGDGSDETAKVQAAVDHCVENGLNLFFPKPENYYLIEDNIIIGNSEGITIKSHSEAVFRTNGKFTGIEIYPVNVSPGVARHRCFFAVIDSENVTIEGGVFLCGDDGVTQGFKHVTNSGEAASAILALRCVNTNVRNTRIYNLLPEGVFGSINDSEYWYRYVAIFGVMTDGFYADGNYIDGVAYSGIETRIACTDTRVTNNTVKNAGAHLTQCVDTYANVPVEEFGSDAFNDGVLVQGNTGIGARTDITIHSGATSVIGNTLIDVTLNKAISVRRNSNGVIVTGNTLICTGDKGKVAFVVATAGSHASIFGNVIINYEKGIESVVGDFILGFNQWVNVDDQNSLRTVIGRAAGLGATSNDTSSSYIGRETGLNSDASQLTAIGFRAGKEAKGLRSLHVGEEAGLGSTGNDNIFLGRFAGRNAQGKSNVTHGNVTFTGLNRTVSWFDAPTDSSQVKIGSRHQEIDILSASPAAPAAGSLRIYARTQGGILRLSARFPNGNIVDIATDE